MQKYEVIIIGSGAGGATLAYALTKKGISVLMLERGGYLPREIENWIPAAVFKEQRYHAKEEWIDKKGKSFLPGMHYYVGGNTKLYGAALLRLREKDFQEVNHYAGISPAWPLSYRDFKPYYLEAEKLYSVHGKRGEDPIEPPEEAPFPFPPVSHEPYIASIAERFRKKGLKPFSLPLGLLIEEKHKENSPCIRCGTCDGFPCLVNAKADAQIACLIPALKTGKLTLLTHTKALRLVHDAKGKKIVHVEVEQKGVVEKYTAERFVVSCGAVNSAALFLRSTSNLYPKGLANRSDQVGRNYMFHQNSVMISVSKEKNPTLYEKTLAINDYYWGAQDSTYPLGHIQLLGNVKEEMLEEGAPFFTPKLPLKIVAQHAVGWWLTSEDLPHPDNRVIVDGEGKIHLHYEPNNEEAHKRLLKKFEYMLSHLEEVTHFFPSHVYLSQKIPLAGCAHQAGTMRFGKDPATSVLDTNCKTHDCDNLYVVDSSFFPSIGAVNPTLTIIANALRVAKEAF